MKDIKDEIKQYESDLDGSQEVASTYAKDNPKLQEELNTQVFFHPIL